MGNVLPFPNRRRRHARVAVRQPVALVHSNGTVATALAVNLSMGGLQVVCDRYTIDALVPSAAWAEGTPTSTIDAHFKLPTKHGLENIHLGCRVAYVAPAEGARYLLGLEFSDRPEVLRGFLDEAATIDSA